MEKCPVSTKHRWVVQPSWLVFALALLTLRVIDHVRRCEYHPGLIFYLPTLAVIGAAFLWSASLRTRAANLGLSIVFGVWICVDTVVATYTLHTSLPMRWSHVRLGTQAGESTLKLMGSVADLLLLYGLPCFILTVGLAWRAFRRPRPIGTKTRTINMTVSVLLLGLSLWVPKVGFLEPKLARDGLIHLLITIPSSYNPPRANRKNFQQLKSIRDPKRKLNVAVIIMESTGYLGTSLGGVFETTPFLERMSRRALSATNAHVAIPYTSKALHAILCGVPPFDGPYIEEARAEGVPWRCLPSILAEHGYHTVFFQTAYEHDESGKQMAKNLGFSKFVSGDQLDSEGFTTLNYFGEEDAVLVEPIKATMQEIEPPWLLTILTNTPHHNYGVVEGYDANYTDNEIKNRWLNNIYYQDEVLEEIVDNLGEDVLADTVLVFVSDHGEAFGEHHRRVHSGVPWAEVTRIPLLLIAPGLEPRKVDVPASQVDVMPTILDLLGAWPSEPWTPRVIAGQCLTPEQCGFAVDENYHWVYLYEYDELLRYGRNDPLQLRPMRAKNPPILSKIRGWRRALGQGRSLVGAP